MPKSSQNYETPLDQVMERAILRTYGYLLRPGGVGLKVYEIPYDVFGFAGSDLRPFDQGTFWTTLIGDLNTRSRNVVS